jgi:hypothetical protein
MILEPKHKKLEALKKLKRQLKNIIVAGAICTSLWLLLDITFMLFYAQVFKEAHYVMQSIWGGAAVQRASGTVYSAN